MPEEIEVPTEQLHESMQEESEEAGRAKEHAWISRVAVSSAILAVAAAITALLASHHSDEAILEQLRRIARREGISLAETIRQALEWRAHQRPARPRFIASGEAKRGPHNTARKSGDLQFQPRSWR